MRAHAHQSRVLPRVVPHVSIYPSTYLSFVYLSMYPPAVLGQILQMMRARAHQSRVLTPVHGRVTFPPVLFGEWVPLQTMSTLVCLDSQVESQVADQPSVQRKGSEKVCV